MPIAVTEGVSQARLDALVAAWPLVGRDLLITRVLQRIASGERGVVLTGAPGVGKSRVARVIVAQAGREGAATEWLPATAAARELPLGVFAPIVPPDLAASTPLELLRRTAALLHSRSRGQRLVLAVDDAHLVDPASATLIHQVAAAGQVFVMATVRTGAAVPDAVTSLWKDGYADRIDVGHLDEPDVAEILRRALGDEIEVATAHRLWAATGGNALFLHELVLAGARSGALHQRGGLWCWRGPLSGDGHLRDVLDARLEPLADHERAALELLAVGEPLSVHVFERMVGIDVVDHLERQELVRIVRADRREEASVAHPLYRDLLVDGMGDTAVAAAREQLAQAVEAAGGRRRGDLLRVALWRLGGPVEPDARVLLDAAAEAEARFDAALAERLARIAVERGGGAEAWHAVASALRAQGRNADAEVAWATATGLETDPARRVMIAQARSANAFFGIGDAEGAVATLDRAIPDATTPALRDTLGALLGMFDLYRGRIDTALATAVPILERGAVGAGARIDAALTVSAAYALRGRPRDAIAIVDDNIALALSDPDVSSIAAGALMAARLLALALDGQLDDAVTAARIVYDLAVDMGTHDGTAGLSFAIGHVCGARGEIDAARRHLLEGTALLREHDRNGYLPWCLGELAYTSILGGSIEEAREAVDAIAAATKPEIRLFKARGDAATLLLRGLDDPDVAVRGFVEAGTAAAADGNLVLAAMLHHDAIRFGGATAVRDLLARLAVNTDSVLVRCFAAHAEAAAAADGNALDEVVARFEALGALLLAAEAAAEAADAHAAAGATAARVASTQRGAALLRRCPGAAPPWLHLPAEVEQISRRQLQVAELAAQGLASREIAERLFLSVRTVDNHLYRVYAKLGVGSREELGAVLRVRRQGRHGE